MFPISFVGQILEGFAGISILTARGELTDIWFPLSEASISSSISSGSFALGNAVGFIMVPLAVPGPVQESLEIEENLRRFIFFLF